MSPQPSATAEPEPSAGVAPQPSAPTEATSTPKDVVYHAGGTEPFWHLYVRPTELRLIELDALRAVATNYVVRELPNGRSYQSPELQATVREQPCSDGMSDRVYPHTVRVQYAQGTFDGCGWPQGYDLGPPP